MRRIAKSAGICLLVLVGLFLAVCTAGEVRQRILVHRAERLLADMHALRLRQSNWEDAQKLMARWGRWGHYDGTCTSQDCFYVISLPDPAFNFILSHHDTPPLVMYFLFGARLLPRQWAGGLREMEGMFLVQDGLIVRSGLSIDVEPSSLALGSGGGCCAPELIMSARSQGSLGVSEGWQEYQRSQHPDYTVWRPGGCTSCIMGRVTYADNVSPEEVARLSDFRLSCATQWRSCLTLEELDPAAHEWHLYGTPRGDPQEELTSQPTPTGCGLPLYSLGRDAARIVSAEALDDARSLGKDEDGFEREQSRVRVLGAVKGDSFWATGSVQDVVALGTQFGERIRKPTHIVKARRYLLFLGKELNEGRLGVPLENCGIVEDDYANKREVRRGIAMDDRLRGAEPAVSLAGFVRRAFEYGDH